MNESGRATIVAAVLLSLSIPAYSGNVITNPTFKDPISCPGEIPFTPNLWSTSTGSNVKVGPSKVNNNTLLRMEYGNVLPPGRIAPSADTSYASQCISGVIPGAYEFGAWVQVNPRDLATPVAEVRVTLFDGTNCTGSVIPGGQSLERTTATGSLVKLAGEVTIPANTASVAFDLIGTFNSSTMLQSVYFDDAFLAPPGICQPGPETHCLQNGRFEVKATWATTNDSGVGRTLPFTDDTGLFWFFNPDNVEVTVKVLNACSDPFNRYWIFASGLTNVEVELTVTDTASPGTPPVVYRNPQQTAFVPIQDTNAFSTCP